MNQTVQIRLIGPAPALAAIRNLLLLHGAEVASQPRPSRYNRAETLQYLNITIQDHTKPPKSKIVNRVVS